MNWLQRLETKYGRYAIRNLPLYIVIMYAVGAVLDIVTDGQVYYDYLALNPYMILHGQPWRIVSFLIAAPTTSIIFLLLVLLFYYSIGQSLCNIWGAFRFNMYFLVGVIATVIGSFLAYAVTRNPYIYMDTYYINMAMFLAYATIFPEAQVYLYGILPVKVKWLAYIDIAFISMDFFRGGISNKIAIIASLLNFILFYFSTRNYKKISPREINRRRSYKKKVKESVKTTRHQCAVCKRTEEDDPSLEFRYCSKCNGEYEYCNDHLFTHTHVQ